MLVKVAGRETADLKGVLKIMTLGPIRKASAKICFNFDLRAQETKKLHHDRNSLAAQLSPRASLWCTFIFRPC